MQILLCFLLNSWFPIWSMIKRYMSQFPFKKRKEKREIFLESSCNCSSKNIQLDAILIMKQWDAWQLLSRTRILYVFMVSTLIHRQARSLPFSSILWGKLGAYVEFTVVEGKNIKSKVHYWILSCFIFCFSFFFF